MNVKSNMKCGPDSEPFPDKRVKILKGAMIIQTCR